MSSKKLNQKADFRARNSLRNRNFSDDYKRDQIKLVLQNGFTVLQVARMVGVTPTTIYKWIYKFSDLKKGTKQVVELESEATKTERLMAEVERLNAVIGRKQMELDFQAALLAIAAQRLDTNLEELKKTVGTSPSSTYASKTDTAS